MANFSKPPKGRAKPKKLTVADLGKNGDQISRLFSEPSDLVVLQHCDRVTSAVRDHMCAFATRIGRLRAVLYYRRSGYGADLQGIRKARIQAQQEGREELTSAGATR